VTLQPLCFGSLHSTLLFARARADSTNASVTLLAGAAWQEVEEALLEMYEEYRSVTRLACVWERQEAQAHTYCCVILGAAPARNHRSVPTIHHLGTNDSVPSVYLSQGMLDAVMDYVCGPCG
jgi:hypothetical protein